MNTTNATHEYKAAPPALRRKRLATALCVASALLLAGASGGVLAARDGLCKDGTPRPCKPVDTGGGESAGNNLSFPVIFSDNASPAGFPQDGAWRFADITNVATQCVDEHGVAAGTPVPSEYLCYYGRRVVVVNEEGEVGGVEFDPYPEEPAGYCDGVAPEDGCQVWWLQKREDNFWRTLTTGHDVTTPLVVSAVDVGDLLESTPDIQTRQIRVEFNLLQDATAHPELEFGGMVVPDWNGPVPYPCTVPDEVGESIGCFAALAMSGAVPGTEQSGNETQGTDFGPGAGTWPGTTTLVDPTTLRSATYLDGETEVNIPVHALVYSHCARLAIQKIDGVPVWDKSAGYWSGPGVGAPLVNTAAYNGWSVEITSGGSIVYGYNWNAKTASTGTYRITFVIDGNDTQGPQCPVTRGTSLGSDAHATTQLVNVGEYHTPVLIREGDYVLGDEGGLVYLDLALTTKGGGGGGGGRH